MFSKNICKNRILNELSFKILYQKPSAPPSPYPRLRDRPPPRIENNRFEDNKPPYTIPNIEPEISPDGCDEDFSPKFCVLQRSFEALCQKEANELAFLKWVDQNKSELQEELKRTEQELNIIRDSLPILEDIITKINRQVSRFFVEDFFLESKLNFFLAFTIETRR